MELSIKHKIQKLANEARTEDDLLDDRAPCGSAPGRALFSKPPRDLLAAGTAIVLDAVFEDVVP